MPNHISNRLTLQCSEDEATKVFAAIGGMHDDGTPLPIDFNKLIPYPERYAQLDRERNEWEKASPNPDWSKAPKDGFNQGGYDWCCEHWGTKWNAYDQELRGPSVLYFETAWAAPEPVMDALAAKFPDVPFTLEYADEDIGSNAGVIRYANGRKGRGSLDDAEAARLWFDLNPGKDPKEYGIDPVTFAALSEDSDA